MNLKTICKLIAAWCIVLSSIHGISQEGNYNLESYGNQSSLLNGNVIASATDLALSYYNPSRLSFTESPDFIINVKAYQYDRFKFENNFGGVNTSSSSTFRGLPSIVAGTFRIKSIPEHKFSYSFISRYRSDLNLSFNSGVIDGPEVEEPLARAFLNLNGRDQLKDEWIGLTWSHKLKDNLSIGVSSFLSIYRLNSEGNLILSGQDLDDSVALQSNRIAYNQRTYGLFFKIGATWVLPDVTLGATITLPYLNVYSKATISNQIFSSGFEDSEDEFSFLSYDDLENSRRTAFGIETGCEYELGKHKLHGRIQWFSKVGSYERLVIPDELQMQDVEQSQFNEAYRAVFNFGLGLEFYLNERSRLIASVTSDFNAHESSISIINQVANEEDNPNHFSDFWHLGLGTDLTLKWGTIVLGGTYSRSSVNFNPESSSNIDPELEGVLTRINYERYRLIVGIEIPLFQDTLDQLKKGIQ